MDFKYIKTVEYLGSILLCSPKQGRV